ncbi:Flp family type IVb pilin [Comamonas sp. HJ-2]
MNKIAQQFAQSLQSFVRDEEGAQVIEYALVVAVVSIALITLIRSSIADTFFSQWLTRITQCLNGAGACAAPAP